MIVTNIISDGVKESVNLLPPWCRGAMTSRQPSAIADSQGAHSPHLGTQVRDNREIYVDIFESLFT